MAKPLRMKTDDLLQMLTFQRRAWEKGEEDFITTYLKGYPEDAYGNFRVEVDPSQSTTLFSCHTDSVHPKNGLRQKVYLDHTIGDCFKRDNHALGADDAVGIWLMLHMIQQGVPGTYVFHRAEEIGGHGSDWIAKNDREFLSRFNRAIAFDRKGTTDVITRQRGGACCSPAFADALSKALGGEFKPSTGGVFTDTANYIHDIPECTNISSGYYNEHTRHETLDIGHAEFLHRAVTAIDWEALPTVRDHTYVPPPPAPYYPSKTYGNAYYPSSSKSDKTPKGEKKIATVTNLSAYRALEKKVPAPNFRTVKEAIAYMKNNPRKAAQNLFLAYMDWDHFNSLDIDVDLDI